MTASYKTLIMRRVYYSYVLGLVTMSIFWQGFFLGAATLLLAHWLHVASIIDNFLAVPVRQVPDFILGSFLGAITHGESMTALVAALSLITAVFAARRLGRALAVRTLALS